MRHSSGFFFFSSRRRHTRSDRDWSSDVCSSDLRRSDQSLPVHPRAPAGRRRRAEPVRQRVREQRGRASRPGAGHRRHARVDRDRAAGDGRGRALAVGCLQMERVAALSAVGNTPLVELPRIGPPAGARIFAKLEEQNPTGSVKDRVALSMVEAAEDSGELAPGQRILEPTSGNTGIALAMIGKVKGYPVSVVMPESATQERVELLRMYGADILFSPGNLGSNGAVAMARDLAERDPSLFMPFQYANEANPAAHYCGTAVEILEQVPDGQVDAFVAGLGTGGTLMGSGRRLREANSDVQIVAAEPLQGDPVMGLRSLEDGYTPPILDIRELDRKVLVSNGEAVLMLRKLLDMEGIFAGVSAGAALAVARRVASEMDDSQNVVVLFADGGSKYMSAGLYTTPLEELEAAMDERVWW